MLQEKNVIVTGGAKGIGKAVALAFAAQGANIALNYHSHLDETVVREIEAYGVKCMAVAGDVGDFAFAQDFTARVKKEWGSIDVLVNNAGITRDTLIIGMKEEQFDEVIRTNLKGTFNMIRHVSKVMLRQKSGSIVNMASVVGVSGNAGQANYAASKAGVIGLTKSVAKELASRGITCNAIAPGYIETDMTAVLKEEIRQQIMNTIPLGCGGSVKDVADAAVFLATNRYITGQVLHVDGGMVM